MIQSSPSMICPYFNDTISYRSSTGLAYYVVCGGQYNNGIDITGGGSTTSKLLELACHQGRLYLAKHVNPSQVLRRASLCGELINSVKPIRSFLTILSQRTKHSELYWSCMVLPQWIRGHKRCTVGGQLLPEKRQCYPQSSRVRRSG